MINYSIVIKGTKPGTKTENITETKAYGVAQVSGILTLNDFARHIAQHGTLYGRDVIGLLGKITKVISEDLQVNMKNIVFNSDKDGFFRGRIVLQIASVDALELLMDKIQSIDGIIDVLRID